MIYLGRCQIGKHLNLFVQTLDAGEPAMPDSTPWLKVFRSDNSIVLATGVPVIDKKVDVGLFRASIFLGSPLEFTEGQHALTFSYAMGGTARIVTGLFDVIPGGDPDGCILNTYYLHRPNADHIVWQTESGRLKRGRNPRAA